MCGIAGILSAGRPEPALLARMAAAIAHRGPDDQGIWIDAEAGVGLAHRRLSIVDLSPHGHQPMHSADGRYVITFNGEIYNHARPARRARGGGAGARRRLARPFRHRDPARGDRPPGASRRRLQQGGRDVRLRLVGPQGARRCTWPATASARSRSIMAGPARDFVFGSELKALRLHPRFDNADRPPRAAACSRRGPMFRRRCRSIGGIFKLEPGCILTITPAQPRSAARRSAG